MPSHSVLNANRDALMFGRKNISVLVMYIGSIIYHSKKLLNRFSVCNSRIQFLPEIPTNRIQWRDKTKPPGTVNKMRNVKSTCTHSSMRCDAMRILHMSETVDNRKYL